MAAENQQCYVVEDFLTFPYQVFFCQFELALIVLLAADMFPTAKPIIHQPEEGDSRGQEKRFAGAISVFHLPQ